MAASEDAHIELSALPKGAKRTAEDTDDALAQEQPLSKKAREDVNESAPAPVAPTQEVSQDLQSVKRDRENATISVGGLPPATDERALKNLFRDCGDIREIKLRTFGEEAVGTVEFMQKDSVQAALTKDKKRIDDKEISVHPGWKSTLYVTNFPESYEADDVQKLFEPFGPIFDTRWPSKRFKSSRRFVYIQYVHQTSAQAALALDGKETVEGTGLRLQVKISDPSAAADSALPKPQGSEPPARGARSRSQADFRAFLK